LAQVLSPVQRTNRHLPPGPVKGKWIADRYISTKKKTSDLKREIFYPVKKGDI